MPIDSVALSKTLAATRGQLLAQRNTHGHWEGELSSSALSTATAVCALALVQQASAGHYPLQPLIDRGLRWLTSTQNADGGWGDTVDSPSNISTTALCWAALAVRSEADRSGPLAGVERYLAAQAGGLTPDLITDAIIRRYGRDHTFSVPILTTLALAGRLGAGSSAWQRVPQLPFELAACPQRCFRLLRLPVVSYALPALIAVGQVRHAHRPTPNPLIRLLRWLTSARTLDVLRRIQPTGGGFLEATPLTSFVVLSLAGAGFAEHPVVSAGVDFLRRSVRADGSWPIDTNLATWVTTLSVNALHLTADADQRPIRRWLLGQQYRQEHAYTGAAPGGWAWTDLPGGVPDADDTAGALLALHQLGPADTASSTAALAGVNWLLDLQNADGGMPTFCRGWGTLPFDRSGADLTAHVVLAWTSWRPALPRRTQQRINRAVQRSLAYLLAQQQKNGCWAPLWFGNQQTMSVENVTYGTNRVMRLTGLEEVRDSKWVAALQRATHWLLAAQNSDGGWGNGEASASSIEETALALEALATPSHARQVDDSTQDEAITRGTAWLIKHTECGQRFAPAPLGLYFAKLWYSERLYPLIFTTAALHRVAEQCGMRGK